MNISQIIVWTIYHQKQFSITSSKCGFKEEVRKGWGSHLRAVIAIQYNWLYFLFFSKLGFLAAHAHFQCWWLEYFSYFCLKPFGLYYIPTELSFRSFLPHYHVPSTVSLCAYTKFSLIRCSLLLQWCNGSHQSSHQHSCPVISQLYVCIKHWHC